MATSSKPKVSGSKATDLVTHPLTAQEIMYVNCWRALDFVLFVIDLVKDKVYWLKWYLNKKPPSDLLGIKHDPEEVWVLCQWTMGLIWFFGVSIFFRYWLGR